MIQTMEMWIVLAALLSSQAFACVVIWKMAKMQKEQLVFAKAENVHEATAILNPPKPSSPVKDVELTIMDRLRKAYENDPSSSKSLPVDL